MFQVVYQLFNSFGFNKEFEPSFTEKLDQMSLWLRINKSEFDELKSNIYNNQNNKDFKITINKKMYDLKNAKIFWMKVTTSKISKNQAKKLYNKLIQKDIDALKREEGNSNNKYNILEILENIGAIFTDSYLHYKEVPKKTIIERNIAESVTLRKRRIPEIEEEEEKKIDSKLFKEYFTNYRSPSDIYIKNYLRQKVKELRAKYM